MQMSQYKVLPTAQTATAAMYVLARNFPNYVPLLRVAEELKVSASYLEQVMAKLRRAGLVKPHKGPNGGYTLSVHPSRISVSSITSPFLSKVCAPNPATRLSLFWNSVDVRIWQYLEEKTLQSILEDHPPVPGETKCETE